MQGSQSRDAVAHAWRALRQPRCEPRRPQPFNNAAYLLLLMRCAKSADENQLRLHFT